MNQLMTYLVVNALVRDRAGNRLVLVRQAATRDGSSRWTLPGGKVEHGESLHSAVRRELREETGLTYDADPALAYGVHYVLPGKVPVHAVVHVFDGSCTDMAVLESGPVASPDADGDVIEVELVDRAHAIEVLSNSSDAVVREPLLAYLTGRCSPGALWSYPASESTEAPTVFNPGHG